MIDGGVLLEGWCQLLLDGLEAGGAREIVVSPGSRSTALVLAALEHAGFSMEVIVDERAAAFYALGRARVSGRPPVLVRTSGSAGGHDLPAVIEAKEAGLPLVIVTADRPHELMGVRAPQTIDQTRLFGTQAVGFFELGAPDPSDLALRAVRRVGMQAAMQAREALGPVQVNLRARKPLEPGPSPSTEDAAFRDRVAGLRKTRAPRVHLPDSLSPSRSGLEELLRALRAARRPLVVAGPAGPMLEAGQQRIAALLERLDAPVFLEATSQLRFGPLGRGGHGLEAFLRSPGLRARFAPDLVLQLGEPAISSGMQVALSEWSGSRRFVIAWRGYPDPDSRAEVIRADPADVAERLAATDLDPGLWDAGFRRAFKALELACAAAADGEGLETFTEATVVRAARAAVPPGGRLMVGNSLPVRHLDLFVPSGGSALTVLHQRGASGIDGLVAGAVAAAREAPCVLVLGDVSARHDLGALALGERAGDRLTIVVLHNGGGRIFEQLPLARRLGLEAAEMVPFVTPDDRSLAPVAEALGFSALVVEDAEALASAFLAPTGGRPKLVEARVPPHDATLALGRMRSRIEETLASER